jgi:HSP20 family molecular chaperone IbpA
MQDLYDRIALRAFEIFDGGGRLQGRDLADWLQAEVEFLHPVHVEVSDSSGALAVRAEIPGFKANELQINVEPRRVTISGKRETKGESKNEKTIRCETCSDQILRVLELTTAVDPEKVKATLKDGVLVLEMPKVPPAPLVKGESTGA